MIADAFVIRLPDGTLHYARPGHVDALCGANRVTNADRWTGTVDAICPACSLLRGGEDDPRSGRDERDDWRDRYERIAADPDVQAALAPAKDAIAQLAREVECPDCGALWPINQGEPCPGCGLSEEDVEAGADFWVALDPETL